MAKRKAARAKAVVGTGLGVWMPLDERKRTYAFANGEKLVVVEPVKMRYIKSGHQLETKAGRKVTIYTNHSDSGRQNLLYLDIDADGWPT